MRWLSRGLIVAGIALLGVQTIAALHALHVRWQVSMLLAEADGVVGGVRQGALAPDEASPTVGMPIGLLEIPRIGVSAAVIGGDSQAVLARGVGHLPDTPLPWQPGNSALAGHRDTFFRPLRHIAVGDLVQLTMPHGTIAYRVTDTFVVDPEALWVLDPTPARTLTLITCYPFRYVGAAPKRFIVRAQETAPSDPAA